MPMGFVQHAPLAKINIKKRMVHQSGPLSIKNLPLSFSRNTIRPVTIRGAAKSMVWGGRFKSFSREVWRTIRITKNPKIMEERVISEELVFPSFRREKSTATFDLKSFR
jgi:hypothetical protein